MSLSIKVLVLCDESFCHRNLVFNIKTVDDIDDEIGGRGWITAHPYEDEKHYCTLHKAKHMAGL